MKKLLAAVLCTAMVASVTACGAKSGDGGTATTAAAAGTTAATGTTAQAEAATEAKDDSESAKEFYQEVLKKNEELTSIDMSLNMDMNMDAGTEKMTMNMKMDVQADGLNEDDMKYYANMSTEADGQSVDMVMFYTDGYYYMDTMGQKVKCVMDASAMTEQGMDITSTDLTPEYIKEISVEEQGDNKIIKITGDAENMMPYVEGILANSGSASSLEGMDVTINDISSEYVVNKDGYYTSMKLVMDIDMEAQGQKASMVINMDSTVNNPGQPVEVTLPSTDGFTEVDASLLEG